jgi:hypothetical protein
VLKTYTFNLLFVGTGTAFGTTFDQEMFVTLGMIVLALLTEKDDLAVSGLNWW